ncbi:MAG: PilZ domain-containing protein [bacterium]|nr:PilZ domain-containing protein [bacterium]
MPLLAITLASYLPFAGPDLDYIYGIIGAILAIALLMVVFRVFARLQENRRVQQSSWLTYEKIAKVKGLSKLETQLLSMILRRARVQRPSQVLGSIRQYETLVDKALDRAWITDSESSHLEKARTKLVRTSRPWDGQNRRQYERALCAFELNVAGITRASIDEELKASYDESDEKFRKAFAGLSAESRSESTRVQDLSAGGVALLAGDKDQFHEGDYLAFSEADGDSPIDLSPVCGCILDVEHMEEQRQLILHVRFLPYDSELRKQVIRAVYEESERAQSEKRDRTGRKKAPADKIPPARKKRPAPPPEEQPE